MALSKENFGLLAGILAYSCWGVVPIFWKQLEHVPADQILAHRIIWASLFVVLVIYFRSGLGPLYTKLKSTKTILTYFFSGLLISLNWGLFIWAVNNDLVLQASLGYFIAPLLNILLGRIFYKETLTNPQGLAIALMCLSVTILIFKAGVFPWVALLLATTFCLYGLARKRGSLDALDGLAIETILMTPFALAYLYFSQASKFGDELTTSLLLTLAGPATALPLIFFAVAVRSLPLKTIGALQYLSPTGQFLLGIFVYNESANASTLVSFAIIWLGLAIYVGESLIKSRKTRIKNMMC